MIPLSSQKAPHLSFFKLDAHGGTTHYPPPLAGGLGGGNSNYNCSNSRTSTAIGYRVVCAPRAWVPVWETPRRARAIAPARCVCPSDRGAPARPVQTVPIRMDARSHAAREPREPIQLQTASQPLDRVHHCWRRVVGEGVTCRVMWRMCCRVILRILPAI